MTTSERANLAISSTAVFLSLLSLAYTAMQERGRKAEQVVTRISADRKDYMTEIGHPSAPYILVLQWTGFLSNNGEVPVSIIGYELWETDRYVGTGSFVSRHSDLDLGMADPAGKSLVFPMTLEPGQAVPIVLRTGVLMEPEMSRVIHSLFPVGSKPSMAELEKLLARQGKDPFGNSVRIQELGKDSYVIGRIEDVYDPTFLLSFSTARGNTFKVLFSVYQQEM